MKRLLTRRFKPVLFSAILAVFATAYALPQTASADAYADQVVDYSPVTNANGQPLTQFRGFLNALGAPDYPGNNQCANAASCSFVTLGPGGSITLQFIDNALTGSDNSDPDLWVYEIGPDVEDTFVEVSADNSTWFPVGKVFGGTSTVDIDAFGFGTMDTFYFVRLTDDPNEGSSMGNWMGADIDAVQALSTMPVPVESKTWGAIKKLQ